MPVEKTWKRYEDVTRQLLSDIRDCLNIAKVESEPGKIKGKSGTDWNIEVIAYDNNNDKLILVECKYRSNSKIPKEVVGGFAYRIHDTQAGRGILVTTIGLQEGAEIIAQYENMSVIQLTIDITNHSDDYIARLTNQLFIKLTDTLTLGGFVSVSSPIKLQYNPRGKFYSTDRSPNT